MFHDSLNHTGVTETTVVSGIGPIWNYTIGSFIFSSPTVANGMVYVESEDGKVYCLPMIMGSTPTAPFNLKGIPGNKKISLIWQNPLNNGVSPITGYKIYRSNSSGTEVLLTMVGNVLTYTDTGLSTNTTYYYEVSAVNSVGDGPKSYEISTTTLASNSTSSSSSTNSQNHKSIGGMGAGAILTVSIIGVMVAVIKVKKHIR